MTERDFDSLYREFQPKIHRYLRHQVGAGEADDLTQIVFYKVSQALAGFRGEAALSTWIYRIATNTVRDHFTSLATRQLVADLHLDDGEAASDEIPDTVSDSVDQECIRREMSACVRGIVDQLPENYRSVLLLSEFEGFTNAEIAAILDLSLETVKIRLHRSRQRLRQALDDQCHLYHDERNELMCDRKPVKLG